MSVELFVFVVAAAACLAGAVGVVASRNPVHAALSLVGTLFGIAVLFVAESANFLAAVQVIVYAGAIVVLFLFVIMLLGVDRADDLEVEPLVGQRVAAVFVALGILGLTFAAIASTGYEATGAVVGFDADVPDINRLGQSLFTDFLFAFEITSILLVIAVVGAVLLARRGRREDEIIDPGQEERAEEIAERMLLAEYRAHPEEFYEAEAEQAEAAEGDGAEESSEEEVKT
jgi:NADH-quinone oxidoreductase subunit J